MLCGCVTMLVWKEEAEHKESEVDMRATAMDMEEVLVLAHMAIRDVIRMTGNKAGSKARNRAVNMVVRRVANKADP